MKDVDGKLYEYGHTSIMLARENVEDFDGFLEFYCIYAIDTVGELWVKINQTKTHTTFCPVEPLKVVH